MYGFASELGQTDLNVCGINFKFLVSFRYLNTPTMPVKPKEKKVVCLTQRNVNSNQEIKEVDSSNKTVNLPLYHRHSLYTETCPQHGDHAIAESTLQNAT